MSVNKLAWMGACALFTVVLSVAITNGMYLLSGYPVSVVRSLPGACVGAVVASVIYFAGSTYTQRQKQKGG